MSNSRPGRRAMHNEVGRRVGVTWAVLRKAMRDEVDMRIGARLLARDLAALGDHGMAARVDQAEAYRQQHQSMFARPDGAGVDGEKSSGDRQD